MSSATSSTARIFFPDNRFPRLARRPGGLGRDEAIANAESEIEGLKDECGAWIDDRIAGLIALAAGLHPQPDDAALENAYDSCAELRDIGTTVGCELVSFVARAFCEVIAAIRNGSPADDNVIACYIDALTLARTPQYRGLRPEQVPELVNGLLRIVEHVSLAPASDAT